MELPDPWPFDQPPNCAVFTTTHVMRDGEPITHIFHDEDDHGWQFHYAGEKSTEDMMIVALKEVCNLDRTIVEVADLPPGWEASRAQIGERWTREKSK